MPLYLWRFSIFGIPTTVLEMMIYILFLSWALNGVHSLECKNFSLNKINSYRLKPELQILNIGIALLFLGLTISTFNSSDLRTSLGIFKGWFVSPFLFFVVFISVIKKEKHIILVLKSWLASGIVISLIGIFYLLNNDLTFDGRLKAFFLSPNYLAMYLAPAFLIVLFFWNLPFRVSKNLVYPNHLNKILKDKFQYPIFSIIILIPLCFTYSYGAFLGIFVGVVYLFLSSNFIRTLRNSIFNIQYSIFLIIIFTILISMTAVKFDQVINSNERSSFHSRLMVWNASAEIIKDNPLFGIGPGTFQDTYLLYAEKFDEPYLEWAVPQPHNIFLAFYLQTGLIGFLGFIFILFWFFNAKLKCYNIQYSIFNILTCLMIYILIHGLIDTTYWKNDLALMFWIIIGMMIVSQKNTKSLSK